eukprot:16437264-Heterocapsa_arctica.AAC.1
MRAFVCPWVGDAPWGDLCWAFVVFRVSLCSPACFPPWPSSFSPPVVLSVGLSFSAGGLESTAPQVPGVLNCRGSLLARKGVVSPPVPRGHHWPGRPATSVGSPQHRLGQGSFVSPS